MGFYPRSCHQQLVEAVIAGRLTDTCDALAAGGDPNRPDALGDTPLLWAAALGHLDLTQTLVEHGADLACTNAAGDTLWHAAARQGQAAILTAWVTPLTDLEALNREGESVWSLALAHNTPAAAQSLAALRPGCAWDKRPMSAAVRLHQALGQGPGHIQAVLDAGGAKAWDVRPGKGRTPWEELLARWPAAAVRWRPEGAPVLNFRRRRLS